MKIEFLHREEINETLWDSCINRSYNRLIYAYTWYMDEVCDEWDALVYDNYTAVMPLPRRRKWGFTYAYQPFFCQQLGIFSTTEIPVEMVNEFFKAIPRHYCYIHLQVNVFSKPTLPKTKVTPRTNHRLPLIPLYEKLATGYNENTRRNLKKAEKAGITTAENADPLQVIKLYTDLYAEKTPEIKESDYQRLQKIITAAKKMGSLKVWGVKDQAENLCAGAIFFTDHKVMYYLMGAANEYGRENGALHLLFDNVIKNYAGHDLVLDFEGSEKEGISRFYKGLGAKQVSYYEVKINRLPWVVRWLKK